MESLDERKKQILGAIIENYIETAEPVGSRTIAKLTQMQISPATIRNEMADLEEMGLLEQPHTSAGRIPSHLGYRTYVDRLMKRYELSAHELGRLQSLMEIQLKEMDTVVAEITNLYSRLTGYTVIGVTPSDNKSYIKNFHVVPIDERTALLIVVTDTNLVKNKKIMLDADLDMAVALRISTILNEKLAGVTNSQITLSKISELQQEMQGHDNIVLPILNFISECMEEPGDSEIFLSGVTNLLDFPEYNNVKRAKELMEFLENRTNLHKAVALGEQKKVRITIGSENEAIELQDCSVILSTYTVGKDKVGTIGLIGPTRMHYSKAVSNIESLARQLEALLPGAKKEDGT